MKTGESEGRGLDECVYTLEQWIEVLDWVKKELLPYGYDMVCTDGAGTFRAENGSPYMTHQSSLAFKDLVKAAHERGIRVGIYDNPMWIHCDKDVLIPGTQYTAGSLIYDPNSDDFVEHPGHQDIWHVWGLATHPGAREWIDGFFKYYHEMGVDMIRMDFLNWYEDGYSRLEQDYCGPGYGRVNYAKALSWCAESAKKYGIFLSLVMPNLYNDAELESKYGNMFRIVSDTWEGTWSFTSGYERGKSWPNWPNCRNQFDGFTYWSHLAGKGKAILDGDFTRLNTYASDAEKEFVISLQLLAGGPIAASDRPTTIGDNLRFYTNIEMLALNTDRFVGHPLDKTLNSQGSNIWHGTMTDGSHIVGFFNREDEPKEFSLHLSELGLSGEYKVRDLWRHANEGMASELHPTVPAHGCKIVKLTNDIQGTDVPEKIYLLGSNVDVNGMVTNWDPKNPTAVVDVIDGEATLVITTTQKESLNVYTATPEQIAAGEADGTLWNNDGPINGTSIIPLSMEESAWGRIQFVKNNSFLDIPCAGIWTIKYTDDISKAIVTYKAALRPDTPEKIYLLGSNVDVNGMLTNWDPKNPTTVVDVIDGEATLVITTTQQESLNVYTATPEQIAAGEADGTLWNNDGPINGTSIIPLSMEESAWGKPQDLKNNSFLTIPYAGIWTIKYTDSITKVIVTYKSTAPDPNTPKNIYLLGSNVDVNGMLTNWDPMNPTAVVDVVNGEATLVITTTQKESLNVYTATPEQIAAGEADGTLWSNDGPINGTSVIPLSMEKSAWGKPQDLKNNCYLDIPNAGVWTIKYIDGITKATVTYKSN
ncbi:alpha-galactosidase [Alistipes timonensis]|nr:hypothetical protein [Alistipes timonensis]